MFCLVAAAVPTLDFTGRGETTFAFTRVRRDVTGRLRALRVMFERPRPYDLPDAFVLAI